MKPYSVSEKKKFQRIESYGPTSTIHIKGYFRDGHRERKKKPEVKILGDYC